MKDNYLPKYKSSLISANNQCCSYIDLDLTKMQTIQLLSAK